MNSNSAKQIASLVNFQNKLPNPINEDDVYNGSYYYLEIDKEASFFGLKEIVACVRLRRISFFAFELKHLSVSPIYHNKGFGKAMVNIAEQIARTYSVPLLLATTRAENEAVNHIFNKTGFSLTTDFINYKTRSICHVWQKLLK